MKRIISVLKNNFKIIAALIIGMLLAGTGVYAATTLASSSVAYDNSTSGGSSTNVKGALDELYDIASTHCPDGYNCYVPCQIMSGTGTTLGDEIACGSEKFYVLSSTDGNVEMLAAMNVNFNTNLQSSTAPTTKFSNSILSGYYEGKTSGSYSSSLVEKYINNYVTSLNNKYGINVSGRAYKREELLDLAIQGGRDSSLSWDSDRNYKDYVPDWILTTSYWLDGTAYAPNNVTVVNSTDYGLYADAATENIYGVRPVITISKDKLESLN